MSEQRKPLREFPAGARVRKPSAKLFDFAYRRTGTVHREIVGGRYCIGVMWDGGRNIFEYPGDEEFAEAAD